MTIEATINGVECYYDTDDHEWRNKENGYKIIPKHDLFRSYQIVMEHLIYNGADERLINSLLLESDKVLNNEE